MTARFSLSLWTEKSKEFHKSHNILQFVWCGLVQIFYSALPVYFEQSHKCAVRSVSNKSVVNYFSCSVWCCLVHHFFLHSQLGQNPKPPVRSISNSRIKKTILYSASLSQKLIDFYRFFFSCLVQLDLVLARLFSHFQFGSLLSIPNNSAKNTILFFAVLCKKSDS